MKPTNNRLLQVTVNLYLQMSREIPRPEDLIGIYTGATPRCYHITTTTSFSLGPFEGRKSKHTKMLLMRHTTVPFAPLQRRRPWRAHSSSNKDSLSRNLARSPLGRQQTAGNQGTIGRSLAGNGRRQCATECQHYH
jgi:hypothetical protein